MRRKKNPGRVVRTCHLSMVITYHISPVLMVSEHSKSCPDTPLVDNLHKKGVNELKSPPPAFYTKMPLGEEDMKQKLPR